MSKFKVGDRVAVYWTNHCGFAQRSVVVIDELSGDTVHFDFNGKRDHAHINQCRKLKSKKRREIWVQASDIPEGVANKYHCVISTWEESHKPHGDWVRFIEAPRKKK